MKTLVVILFVLTTSPLSSLPVKSDADAIEVFQKLFDTLSSYKTINYNYHRSINYVSERFHNEIDGTIFLEFDSSDTILGFKYQVESKDYRSIYNGAELFNLDKKNNTIKINYDPQFSHMESQNLFTNSIVTLKNALPQLISNIEVIKTVADTVIDSKSYYLASFILHSKTLGGFGNLYPITLKRDFLYRIVIDKDTGLPLQVLQTNNAEPEDYILTTFTEFKLDTDRPSDISWYHSTYTNKYEPASDTKLTLINQNMIAPDWQSVIFDSSDSVQLADLKGNIVLLEFWIKNCGYCIAAVPKLNTIIEKYKDQKLQVIGINRSDTKEDVQFFYEKNRPGFKTINDQDGTITIDYGIDAFPTVVLIDQKGAVIYAGAFDQKLLDNLLEEALNKLK